MKNVATRILANGSATMDAVGMRPMAIILIGTMEGITKNVETTRMVAGTVSIRAAGNSTIKTPTPIRGRAPARIRGQPVIYGEADGAAEMHGTITLTCMRSDMTKTAAPGTTTMAVAGREPMEITSTGRPVAIARNARTAPMVDGTVGKTVAGCTTTRMVAVAAAAVVLTEINGEQRRRGRKERKMKSVTTLIPTLGTLTTGSAGRNLVVTI